jgi:hypothetical protein
LQGTGPVELQGIGDLVGLGALIQSSLAQGNVSISQNSQVIDMRTSGMREEMLETLKQHGIDVDAIQAQANQAMATQQAQATDANAIPPQAIDMNAIPGLGPAVLGLLAQHGVDLDGDGVPDNMQQPKPD